TSEQANLIARYTKEIVLMMDSDTAGQKAIKKASQLLENTGLSVRVVIIPDGKDPDEFIKKSGPERFKALLEGAVSDIEYKLLMAAEGVNLDSDDGRLQYLSRAAEVLASDDDVMTRDIYIGRLCEKYGVSRTALTAKVDDLRRKRNKYKQNKEISEAIKTKVSREDINPERRISPKAAAAEETVIAVLMQHPDFYVDIKELLPPDKMVTTLNKRIYSIMTEILDSGRTLDISAFAEKLIPAELGYLVALANSEKAGQNAKTVLKDCIEVILEEESRINAPDIKEASVEDWASNLQNIINKKKKGN
ncbi:MAG: toprim domain-containing protein, partial [Clostridia bacterium]|nr:toprim domain-containing protein [Clostridia bacterium]